VKSGQRLVITVIKHPPEHVYSLILGGHRSKGLGLLMTLLQYLKHKIEKKRNGIDHVTAQGLLGLARP